MKEAMTVAIIISCLALIGCDQSSGEKSNKQLSSDTTTTQTDANAVDDTSSSVPPTQLEKKETVQTLSGAPPQTITLEPVTDPAMIATAQSDIAKDGYECASVTGMWKVVGSSVDAGVWKADCGSDGFYQLTALNEREFIKPWTGVILGQ